MEYGKKKVFFRPEVFSFQKSYTIVIPPPNVTGSLHIGHALVNTLQDVLVRRKRMQGYNTLWLPGVDHAGIATQMVVEKDLLARGINRKEMNRQQFLDEVWQWKERSGSRITYQLKKLGASLDWTRERFTLDEMLSKAVRRAFVQLYKKGYIYRGEYLVSWCPQSQTALSDLEVEYKEVQGQLTEIRYPLENSDEFIHIATTRPETLLGDTAIAVHPQDERYKKFIGSNAIVPLVKRVIPIIGDESCRPEFGTGAVKITPAHDPNDFLIGKKHKLPFVSIFTENACINNVYPPLQGVERFQARKKIIQLLKEQNLWVASTDYTHSVGHSQRSKAVVEPRISLQWFCDTEIMAGKVLEKIKEKKFRVVPSSQEKILIEWLTNIDSWCISRQLWWGHRLPVWYCDECHKINVSEEDITDCEYCQSGNLRQETDVLDTWFSSGLFPFSTLGWPEKTADYEKFYPNSTLITAYDILFFWVARMAMLGIELTGELPFPETFTHGLIRDAQGKKMSKTIGNVIDPMDIIESEGADTLRLTLCSLTHMAQDIKLSDEATKSCKFFLNKVWNMVAFALPYIEKNENWVSLESEELHPFDTWILRKLDETIQAINEALDTYNFYEYYKIIRNFTWNIFCGWYIEMAKPLLLGKISPQFQKTTPAVLKYCIENILLLLHPIVPFITEELWHKMSISKKSIVVSKFPVSAIYHQNFQISAVENFLFFIETIRTIRGENLIHPSQKIPTLFVSVKDNDFKKLLSEKYSYY